MSLAYKLWKVGRTLTESEIMESVRDKAEMIEGKEPQFVNINFQISNNEVKNISFSKESISKERMFFTKKMGGAGEGIYYLYPNLNVQKETLQKKIIQLLNTLQSSVLIYANEENQIVVKLILSKIDGIKKHIQRAEAELEFITLNKQIKELKESLFQKGSEEYDQKKDKEINRIEVKASKNKEVLEKFAEENKPWDLSLLSLCQSIIALPKGNYWFWFSINGKTFYELMPEVWDNWYKKPVRANNSKKIGYDIFANEEIEMGYNPEVKVFSYDQYHDSMKYRLDVNLPLSLESARNIKFAWTYILNNLVFYYKGLEYVIIPNLISDDMDLYKTVLNRFRRANKNSSAKRSILERLNLQESNLIKDIDKLKKKEKSNKIDNEEIDKLVHQREEILSEIKEIDTGIIGEFDEQINEVGDIKNAITVDYIFTSIFRSQSDSFEIKGSIEDVVPSHVQNVVAEMANLNISDLVKLRKRDRHETLLQDFFNREELSLIKKRATKDPKTKKLVNIILQERLYLAKLLLTDAKIEFDQLLRRFEENRLFGYDSNKRLTKDDIYEWIEFSSSFIRDEDNIYKFLKRLNKIKGC